MTSVDHRTTGHEDGRDVFAGEWADYLDARDQRGNDLDGAESDARALGFASRAERDAYLRARALRTLSALILDADPDGFGFGTDPDYEADRYELADDDIGDEAHSGQPLDRAAVDELVRTGVAAYLRADHERGYHDPAQRVDETNDRPNLSCPDCQNAPAPVPTPPGILPADPFERWRDAAIFSALRTFAANERRARAVDMLDTAGPGWAYTVTAPAAHPIAPDALRDEQRETLDVYGSTLSGADWSRLWSAACEPCRAGRHVDCEAPAGDCTNVCHPMRYGWRGEAAAHYDASAERFALSPSGPWRDALPAIYAAGLDAASLDG